MNCTKCGAELENNALVCPTCGQAVSDEERIQAQAGGEPLTKKDFFRLPAMKSCKSNIISCGVLLYVLGGINFALQIYLGSFPIDGILLVLLGLGIHLGKSRVCALICAAYSISNMLYMMFMTEKVTGWLIIVIGIDAVTYTFKYQSAWNKYKQDGTLPVEKDKK